MIAPFYNRDGSTVFNGDCLSVLREQPNQSVHCCVTSPPYYGLRDYGVEGQLGLEQSPNEYVAKMVEVFSEVKRVLRDDGTLWLNLGDSYAANQSNNGGYSDKSTLAGFSNSATKGRIANETGEARKLKHGLKPKDLIGIPWRVAFALQADGWYLRQDIIWHKPNPMPESVRDRCTKAHEYIFLLSKSQRYYFDSEAMKEKAVTSGYGGFCRKAASKRFGTQLESNIDYIPDGTRNRRSVWSVTTKPYREAHFATFPADLITPCILAGCPVDGVVLDPFAGSGTTCEVARKHGRQSIGIELNPAYCELSVKRLLTSEFSFNEVDE